MICWRLCEKETLEISNTNIKIDLLWENELSGDKAILNIKIVFVLNVIRLRSEDSKRHPLESICQMIPEIDRKHIILQPDIRSDWIKLNKKH